MLHVVRILLFFCRHLFSSDCYCLPILYVKAVFFLCQKVTEKGKKKEMTAKKQYFDKLISVNCIDLYDLAAQDWIYTMHYLPSHT